MRQGRDLIGKPIYSISDGRRLGEVRDIYIDSNVYWMTGIHLGSEGLLRRTALVIHRDSVVVFGVDAVLVKNSNVVSEKKELEGTRDWLRLENLKGREVDTPGGTKVGTVGDVVLDEEARVVAITLSRTYVSGPISEKANVARDAIIDSGSKDGAMTIDMIKAEKDYMAPDQGAMEAEPEPEG